MMLHPATVHFAMVLPVVASVFGLIYLFKRDELMSKISSRATLIAALAMIGVWYTGNQAGPEIYDYLSDYKDEDLRSIFIVSKFSLIQNEDEEEDRSGVAKYESTEVEGLSILPLLRNAV